MKTKKQLWKSLLCFTLLLSLMITLIPPVEAEAATNTVFYAPLAGKMNYDYAKQLMNLINNQRKANGLPALQLDKDLTERAMLRAQETVKKYSTTRPNGEDSTGSLLNGMTVSGTLLGELVVSTRGYTPSELVTEWMKKSSSKDIMLDKSWGSFGIGCVEVNGKMYWVQLFKEGSAKSTSIPSGVQSFVTYIECKSPYVTKTSDCLDYSAVFNADYYLNKYADVKNAYGIYNHGKAFYHFVNSGMAEGRRGNAEFDVQSYKNQYADLRNAFGNNLPKYYMHYVTTGKAEGRKGSGYVAPTTPVTPTKTTVYKGKNYNRVYDFDYYINKYADVKKAYKNNPAGALAHFVNFGMKEGRQGRSSFDVYSYKNRYSDLRSAFGNDLTKYYLHYINTGYKEGRKGTKCTTIQNPITKLNGQDYSRVYNYNYYINKYPDVKKAYGGDDIAVLQHFINNGMKEGRQAKASFNVKVYRSENADLRKAFGTDFPKYYMHYITTGYKEGRVAK